MSHARKVRATAWTILLLVLVCAAAGSSPRVGAQEAKDRPATVEAVAAAVLECIAEGDDDRLRTLGKAIEPDPWEVAEALCEKGERDAALRLSKADDRPAVRGLTGYVAERKAAEGNGAWRARISEAKARLSENAPDEALAKLGDGPDPNDATVTPILRVQVLRVRARCLAKSERPKEAAAVHRTASGIAESIGWVRGARVDVQAAANQAQTAQDWDAMAGDWTAYGRMSEQLAQPMEMFIANANVGAIRSFRGDYRGALATFEKASAALAELQQTDDIKLHRASVLDNRSVIASWLGRYAQALELARDALELRSATATPKGLAASRNRIAQVQFQLGSDDAALRTLRQAQRDAESEKDDGELAAALAMIGLIERRRGAVDRARVALEQALGIYAARDDRSVEQYTRAQLALVRADAGETERAIADMSAAVRALEGSGKGIRATITRMEYGVLLLRNRDFERALIELRASLEAARDLGTRELEAACLRGTAFAHLATGEHERSAQDAWLSAEIMRETTQGLSTTQIAGLRRTAADEALGHNPDPFSTGISAALALDDPDVLFRFVEAGRAATVLVSLSDTEASRMRSLVPPDLLELDARSREDEATASHRLAAAVAEGQLKAVRARRKELAAARVARREAVARIQSTARRASGLLYPRVVTLAEFRSVLRRDQACVQFEESAGELVALVVTPDAARIVRLGSAADAHASCAELLDAVREDTATGTVAERLARRIIRPLGLDESKRELLVVAGGAVGEVPFALLAPSLATVRIPSATSYTLLLTRRERRGRGVLAVGDPALPPDRARSLAQLPSAADEARAVGDTVLIGNAATEEAWAAALHAPETRTEAPEFRRWSVLHFACHGVVDPDRPWDSSLVLSPGGDEDGRLTALEVVGRGTNADLAVLSACETARGTDIRGEGLVGLAPAFLAAGCPRVIVSLWRVDDQATRVLMEALHAAWKAGKPITHALRAARDAVRSDPRWKHPRFWAAWQCWGLGE